MCNAYLVVVCSCCVHVRMLEIRIQTRIFFNWLRLYNIFHCNTSMEVLGQNWMVTPRRPPPLCANNILPIVVCSDGLCCCLHITYIVYNTLTHK